MRQQAMENLLIEFEKVVDEIKFGNLSTQIDKLKNLTTKSKILRDRSDSSASVIKELMNK